MTSARRCREIFAAAPGTRRSSMRCEWQRRRCERRSPSARSREGLTGSSLGNLPVPPDPLHRPSTRERPMSETATPKLELGRVGESVPRVDGTPKVTGEFAYSSDLQAAGMLWGHTVRSAHAHARIVAIDISGAVGMPGVHAVLTHEDVPGEKRYGLEFQ